MQQQEKKIEPAIKRTGTGSRISSDALYVFPETSSDVPI
jgi:hypothetical protein